jgi:phosphoglycerate kinase
LFSNLENAKKTIENNKNCIILLENIRFYPEEENKAPLEKINLFQKKLSELADIYVNDAFGTSHRAHCSIIAKGYSIKLGGFLIKKELQQINNVIQNPTRPFTCILGGAKVSDKIKLIYNLLEKVDDIIIGGGMAFTFLKVLENMEIGNSLFDQEGSNEIPKIIEKAKKHNVNIHLPLDFVGSKEFSNIESKVFDTRFISEGYMGLDIGIRSIIYFDKIIKFKQNNFMEWSYGSI